MFWNYTRENIKFDILIELPHTSTVEMMITESIPVFNSIFPNQKCNIMLNKDPHQYELFVAKKNGSRNLDFPGNFIITVSHLIYHLSDIST